MPVKNQGIKHSHEDRRRTLHLWPLSHGGDIWRRGSGRLSSVDPRIELSTGGRVELRKVGDRDIAKPTSGIGRCGNELRCVKWIENFESISVRMAKEQSLPISAEGLAGACGRLRCCLQFEYDQYRQVNKLLPKIGELVGTPSGAATVIVGHRMKETVSVRYDDDRVLELPLAEVVTNQPSFN